MHAHDHQHHHHDGHARAHAGHGHGHAHAPADFGRAFAIGIGLNTAFVAIEAGYGIAADSLALLADAGHNLGDVFGLALAWFGAWLGRRAASRTRSYGWRKATILAAFINAATLLVLCGGLAWEALERFAQPPSVAAATVVAVAAVGIVVNGITAWLFVGGREHDLNLRGAFLHMAADALVSLGVVLAGLAIAWTGAAWIDPALSLAIVAVIVWSTWDLARESLDMLLDSVPRHIDLAAVERAIAAVDGVAAVHHVHVWRLSTTEVALTAHVVQAQPQLDGDLLVRIGTVLREGFGIRHCTLQMEHGACAAGETCDGGV